MTSSETPSSTRIHPNVFNPPQHLVIHAESPGELGYLHSVIYQLAGGIASAQHINMFAHVIDGVLDKPAAPYVASDVVNISCEDIEHNGKVYKYMGYSPLIQCSIYKNPDAVTDKIEPETASTPGFSPVPANTVSNDSVQNTDTSNPNSNPSFSAPTPATAPRTLSAEELEFKKKLMELNAKSAPSTEGVEVISPNV